MTLSLTFTYFALAFIIVLFALFILKKRNLFRSKLFLLFLLLCLLSSITDITNYMVHINLNETWQKISWISHWIIVLLTFYSYFIYMVYFAKKLNYRRIGKLITKEKTILFITIFLFVEILVYIFILPYNAYDINNFNYVPGISGIVNTFATGFIVSTLFVIIFINRKNIKQEEIQNALFQGFVEVIAVVASFIFKSFSFVPFAEMLTAVFIYCNYENPDLIVSEEVKIEKNKIEKRNKTKVYLINSVKNKVGLHTENLRKIARELNKSETSEERKKELIQELGVPANEIINLLDTRINISNLIDNNIIRKEKYRVRTFVDGIVSHVETKKVNQKVKFEYDINPNIPFVLMGDVEKISAIVNSLLDDAMYYTEYGKIILNISYNPISNEKIELLINVIDTGSGMTQETMDRINNNNNLNGISFLRIITESLNGTLMYESTLGAGTMFYLKIPQDVQDGTPMGGYTKFVDYNKKDIDYKDYNHKRVLIVDDNDISVRVLSNFLLKYNLDIEVANSGLGCIKQVKDNVPYDIIFMDDYMKGTTGKDTLELIQKIAKVSKYNLPPVVIFTANAISGAKEDYINRGFAAYIEKPIDPHVLDKILAELFKE